MDETNAENGTPLDRAAIALEEQPGIPLLEDRPGTGKEKKSLAIKAIRKTFKGTAHLANLLPTGSVLAFQILSPALTHQGNCNSIVSKYMTSGLLGLCSISCFLLCFTDSIRDEKGKVRYGLATRRGLWIIDGSVVTIPPEDAAKYKMKFIDFFHGFTSMLVFGAVALFDQNVVNCFYPTRSYEAQEVLNTMPCTIGVICSLLFIAFPATRHGIGFPLSKN